MTKALMLLWQNQGDLAMKPRDQHSERMTLSARITLLIVAGLAGLSELPATAQTRSLSECSEKLTARGFNVIDRELDDGLFEFEAIKNNEKWDIKMDQKCNILLKKIDD